MIVAGPVRRTTCRICSAPEPSSIYAAYGMDPPTSTAIPATLFDAAWENVRRVLQSATWVSRYSTGDWPILYTASAIETARAEKGFWIGTSVFSKPTSPSRVHCMQFALELSGTMVDCMAVLAHDARVVHPIDYTYCHGIAGEALKLGVAFLEVPSARLIGGVNYPVFKLDAVVQVDDVRASYFEIAGSRLQYVSGPDVTQVIIDDVFGSLP